MERRCRVTPPSGLRVAEHGQTRLAFRWDLLIENHRLKAGGTSPLAGILRGPWDKGIPTGAVVLDNQGISLSRGTIQVIDKSMPTMYSDTNTTRDIGPSRSTPFRHLGDDLRCAGSEPKRPLAVVYRNIAELAPYERNARIHSKAQIPETSEVSRQEVVAKVESLGELWLGGFGRCAAKRF